jgi:ribosomal-protein-alanine N-acetyltransferase
MSEHAPRVIETARLRLVAPDVALAAAVADYQVRNRAHFQPWDPPLPQGWGTADFEEGRLRDGEEAFQAGQALRWWLVAVERPGAVIGSVHLSAIVRGAFQSCHLGYAIDAKHEGQGLMTEALSAVVETAFAPVINLHRLQAAVQPSNLRSLALLARLGFSVDGLARDYLFIAGQWRDHHLLSLRNASFRPPAHWAAPRVI